MVEYRNAFVRSVRRIRLEFSSALAPGAFSPSWFTLETVDFETGDPVVVAGIAVPNQPNYVELALDRDLSGGARYLLHIAAGVPALDASTAAAADQNLYPPAAARAPSVTFSAKQLMQFLFQEDIAHSPTSGHMLAPNADLATVTGAENARATSLRGVMSEGLPHRRSWGARIRQDIDAPAAMLPTLRGKIERQIRRDDRVTDCRASAQEANDGDVYLVGELSLIGQVKTNFREKVRAGS